MSARYLRIASLLLVIGCRSEATSDRPKESESVVIPIAEGHQSQLVEYEGKEFVFEFDLPAGAWYGGYDQEEGMHDYRRPPFNLTVVIAPLEDFQEEVDRTQELATRFSKDARVEVVVPDRRVQFHVMSEDAAGDPFSTQCVTLKPDASIPLGVAFFVQAPAGAPNLNLEPTIASVRIARK